MNEWFPSLWRPHPDTRSVLCDPTLLQTACWGYGVLLGTRSKTPLEVPGAQTSLFVEGFLGQITLGSRGLPQALLERQTFLFFLDPLWL